MNNRDRVNNTSDEARVESSVHNVVYDDQDPNIRSKFIYFYYLTEDTGIETTAAYVAHRRNPILHGNVQTSISAILNEITLGSLQPSGSDLGDIVWRHKSYIVVVLDSPGEKLTQNDAVTFELIGGGGNHSFRAGKDIPALPAPYQHLSAFYCYNLMKHKDGHVLGDGEFERFQVVVNHGQPQHHVLPNMFTHQDSATNLGPPRV